MNERSSQKSIRDYLQQSEVQDRIQQQMLVAREKATVTISQAALLFNFTENKLRDWEKKGLLQTERSLREKEGKGHRQYSPAELDKLAIIRELVTHGRFPLADIPPDVEKVWMQVASTSSPHLNSQPEATREIPQKDHRPIDKRVEDMDEQEFWRYFVSQALRLSLLMICEDLSASLAGLILPLENRRAARSIDAPEHLPNAGLSLVGWMGLDSSFYSFLDDAPSFEVPSDFRLEKLFPAGEQSAREDIVLDNVFIVVQRKVRSLSLSAELAETIRRLLQRVYAHQQTWQVAFDYGRHDWLYQAHTPTGTLESVILNNLVARAIEVGGTTSDGHNRWSFCALLEPGDTTLPIQQQILVVRAQTSDSPYEVGVSSVDPALTDSLSLKAFQSGQVIHFAQTLPGESMTTYQLPAVSSHAAIDAAPSLLLEQRSRSALALPINGDNGISVAVLYVASETPQAFTLEDQRVLRLLGRMIEELLLTSHVRHQMNIKPTSLVTNPSVVDTTFGEFSSETAFIAEVENLLQTLQKREPDDIVPEESLAIISVDIDNQSRIAAKYSNRVARNLSQLMGFRIRGQMRSLDKYSSGRLFHISADKYYLLIERISLEEARNLARQLKQVLLADYRINPSSATPGRPALRENLLEIPDVKVHLGISWYKMQKLKEVLNRHNPSIASQKARALMVAAIEETLDLGKAQGGDCIYTWDEKMKGFIKLD